MKLPYGMVQFNHLSIDTDAPQQNSDLSLRQKDSFMRHKADWFHMSYKKTYFESSNN